MSDRVQDLLARGLAALKAELPANAEEARHCLERVIGADDAEPGQKVKAWLGLSRIQADPARRRLCFGSALALDPGNPEARQGLAIMDGRLRVEDIADPDRPPQPVILDPEPTASDGRRLVCSQCGAKVSVKVGEQAPACMYCGAYLEEEGHDPERGEVKEQDFFAALPTAKAHRWEYPKERMLKCEGCGATFILPPLQLSGACPFCGSTHVVHEATADLIQPDALLPFQFDRAEASRYIQKWLEAQRFCPADLASCARTIEPRSAFMPFWTFDIGGTMDWRALVAERHGERTEWVPQTGVHIVYQDDLLIPASRSVSDELSGAYADFKTAALLPYSAELLAGHATEIYQVTLADASVAARQRALQEAKVYEQKGSLAGKRYRDFFMNSAGMMVDSYKLVLLPLWFAFYCYREDTFPVAVNGQTGSVAGRIPRNWLQRTLASFFS